MKYFDSFLDNWFLPICLMVVSGWLSLRQKFIFNEHKDMLSRIVHLESKCDVIETKMTTMTDIQKETRDDVKRIFKLVTDIRIQQASQKTGDKTFLQD